MVHNVRITMFTRNGTLDVFHKDASYPFFLYNNETELYVLDAECIHRMQRENGILEDECELIYHQGDPLPDGSKIEHGDTLYNVVLSKIVEATTETSAGLFDGFINFFKRMFGL